MRRLWRFFLFAPTGYDAADGADKFDGGSGILDANQSGLDGIDGQCGSYWL